MKRTLLSILMFAVLALPAVAVEPDEMLLDPDLESRARAISKELRCVVCQNQDIDSSNAGVARDLRILVRERLKAGDDDQEVIAFIQARYGDYVLMRPPFKPTTYVLWLAPPTFGLIALVAGWLVLSGYRSRRRPDALSKEDELLINDFILDKEKGE